MGVPFNDPAEKRGSCSCHRIALQVGGLLLFLKATSRVLGQQLALVWHNNASSLQVGISAAAAAAGIVLGKKPEESPQKRGQPNRQPRRPSSANGQQAQRQWSRGDNVRQTGAGSSEPGEIAPQDVDKIRRQKAQGRYRPY